MESPTIKSSTAESAAQESAALNGAPQPTTNIHSNGTAHSSLHLTAIADEDARCAQALFIDQRAFEDESQAWKLHGRLIGLHAELHPEERAERLGFQRALRHLKSWDPIAAHQIQELVQEASRSLKAAYRQLETVLEAGLTSANEATETRDETMSESESDTDSTTPDAEPSPDGVLPPTRAAASRVSFGRSLRAELRFEKARFFDAAKEHGLKTRGQYEKAMWAALSEFWGEPINSRRAPSSRQWARAASAIETEDLRW